MGFGCGNLPQRSAYSVARVPVPASRTVTLAHGRTALVAGARAVPRCFAYVRPIGDGKCCSHQLMRCPVLGSTPNWSESVTVDPTASGGLLPTSTTAAGYDVRWPAAFCTTRL